MGTAPKLGNRGGSQDIQRAVAPKRCKIGPKLLLRTNRKSHMRFQLAPISVTLDALERPKCRPLVELKSSYGAHHKNFNEGRLMLSATKSRPMDFVSINIKYMGMFMMTP